MNKLFYFFLAISIVSCNENSTNNQKRTQPRKMDSILNEIFDTKYPTYKTNDLVKEYALKELVKKTDSLIPLHYLEDIPLKVLNIKKNPHGKGALVQLYTDNYDYNNSKILTNQLHYDIIGFMSEDLASTMNKDSLYYIFGKKYKRLNHNQSSVLVNQTYNSPEPEISEQSIGFKYTNLNVGIFLCEIDSIKLFK